MRARPLQSAGAPRRGSQSGVCHAGGARRRACRRKSPGSRRCMRELEARVLASQSSLADLERQREELRRLIEETVQMLDAEGVRLETLRADVRTPRSAVNELRQQADRYEAAIRDARKVARSGAAGARRARSAARHAGKPPRRISPSCAWRRCSCRSTTLLAEMASCRNRG